MHSIQFKKDSTQQPPHTSAAATPAITRSFQKQHIPSPLVTVRSSASAQQPHVRSSAPAQQPQAYKPIEFPKPRFLVRPKPPALIPGSVLASIKSSLLGTSSPSSPASAVLKSADAAGSLHSQQPTMASLVPS